MSIKSMLETAKRKVLSWVNKGKTADFPDLDGEILEDMDNNTTKEFIPLFHIEDVSVKGKFKSNKTEYTGVVMPPLNNEQVIQEKNLPLKNRMSYKKQKSQQKNWSKWKKKI